MALLYVLAALLVSAWSSHAAAHTVGLSRGSYLRTPDGLDIVYNFSPSELTNAVPDLDQDADGELNLAEARAGTARLARWLTQGVLTSTTSAPCVIALRTAELNEHSGVVLRATARCSAASTPIQVKLAFLGALGSEHRHAARVETVGAPSDHVYFGARNQFEVSALGVAGTDAAPERGSFLRLGLEHILAGYDHLAFLSLLALGAASWLVTLRVVTAFTLGHACSLILSVLGAWQAPAHIVEPAIALSIVYVAVENLRTARPRYRTLLSVGFGLVHGLGFAGALQELSLPRADLASALLQFNLGVELGQLLVLLPILFALRWLKARAGVPLRALPACSIVLGACGMIWFVARLA